MTILKAEWLIAWRNRRLLFFNTVIPVIFVAPVLLSGAPGIHVTAILVVLFAMFATFGSSIPLIRDHESGLLQRYVMTGINPGLMLLERTLAFVTIDFLQLLPAQLLILVVTGGAIREAVIFLVTVALSLFAGNLIGNLVASLARSIAEGALFSSLLSLYMVHLAGVFRVPTPGSLLYFVEPWTPFRPLYLSIRTLVAGTEQNGGLDLTTSLVFTLALTVLTYLRGRSFLVSR